MYYISEFCRVCLQLDQPLVDIMKKEADQEALINKLKLCVSEVEWSVNQSILMCQVCIGKLNAAFEFKQQCLQSAQALENYVSHLEGLEDPELSKTGGKHVSVKRNEVNREFVHEYMKLQKEEEESQKQAALVRVKSTKPLYPQLTNLPNIILATNNTNQNSTFQNIFLNLIPSTAIKCPTSNLTLINKANNANAKPSLSSSASVVKDANQNMFVNVNSALHKLFPAIIQNKECKPSPPMPLKGSEEVNISRILTETKTEELSVEVDPMCFDYLTEDDQLSSTDENDAPKDWEELISSNKIGPETVSKSEPQQTKFTPAPVPAATKISDSSSFIPHIDNGIIPGLNKFQPLTSYVPIRPKTHRDMMSSEFEEKMMEFLNFDHFMAQKDNCEQPGSDATKLLSCEQCGQMCDTLKALRYHVKQFHLGKFPYKCQYCSSVYAMRSQYEAHMQKHTTPVSEAFSKDTITLEDLSSKNDSLFLPAANSPNATPQSASGHESFESMDENCLQFEHRCEMCPRSFNSAHGLSRHKVRKHNQQTRRKYFVKGMKNAKCDICNREFSTQSYLQLHIKLHYRKNDYRLKVFNKDKYDADKQKVQDDGTESEDTKTNDDKSAEGEGNSGDNLAEEAEADKSEAAEDEKEVQAAAPPSPEKSAKEPRLTEGIKIKINLRNLKHSPPPECNVKSKTDSGQNSEESAREIAPSEGSEVAKELALVNGNSENSKQISNRDGAHLKHKSRLLSSSSETSHDMNMDCDENREMLSPHAELSEEVESLKGDGSPEGRRSPIKIVLVDGKPQCSFCYKLFSRKHDLKRHINNIHLKAIQYVCHLCNSQFYEAFHLTRHLRQHNSFVRCTGCMKDFSVLRDLKLHIIAVHENAAPCQCGTCGQAFQKIKHLRDHMHEHDKTVVYKCHICGDKFRESRELSKHLVGHSGIYSCGACQMTFATDHEHNSHMKCHAGDVVGEERYECEICHSKFKKKRYLSVHMNNRHSLDKHDFEVLIDRVESEHNSS